MSGNGAAERVLDADAALRKALWVVGSRQWQAEMTQRAAGSCCG